VSLRGLSQDGSRVFLVTTQKMTADDTDAGQSDVYVALPPPTATTAAATGVGSGSATLHGTVNPSGLATSYRFDIGKSTAYGGQTPSVSAGAGEAAVAAAQAVGGLEPNTTYHFRVRATNPSGTVVGADRTFTTTSAGAGGGGGGGGVVVLPEKANLRGVTKTIKVAGSRRFKLSFRATPGLTGTATFPSAKKVGVSRRQKVTLARKSFRVPASGKVTLKVRLSKKSFRILRRNRKIKVRLKVTLKNPAGATSTARKTITLEAPKRRRR
jgi:hypothetical protein